MTRILSVGMNIIYNRRYARESVHIAHCAMRKLPPPDKKPDTT